MTRRSDSPIAFQAVLLKAANSPGSRCASDPPPAGIKLVQRSRSLEALPQPRFLGLDLGSKRIGVAVSDELGLTAQPVLTLVRRRNPREDLRSLARLARRFSVAAIVVGNPLHLSGEKSPRSENTQAFAAELGELTGLPVHLWDERLTTREAHQILYEAGRPRQDHRRVVDQVAATLILQSFLDHENRDHENRENKNGDNREHESGNRDQ
jgi:putative Holliday junction resolvase